MSAKTQEEVQGWIIQWLEDNAGVLRETIELDKPFADYRLDSLTAVEFSEDVEEWLGIQLTVTVLWNHPTISKMTQYLVFRSNGKTEEEVNLYNSNSSINTINSILAGVEKMSDAEAKRLLNE